MENFLRAIASIKESDLESLAEILNVFPEILQKTDSKERSLLNLACLIVT